MTNKIQSKMSKNPIILPRAGQDFSLVSYNMLEGVIPSKNGIYGVGRVFGTASTVEMAEELAKEITPKLCEFECIAIQPTGAFFPFKDLTQEEGDNVVEIDRELKTSEALDFMDKEINQLQKSNLKKQKEDIKEIQKKAEQLRIKPELIANQEPDSDDPIDTYITKRTTKGMVQRHFYEVLDNLSTIFDTWQKAVNELKVLDDRYPDAKDLWKDRYNKALAEVGTRPDHPHIEFMNEPLNKPLLREKHTKTLDRILSSHITNI